MSLTAWWYNSRSFDSVNGASFRRGAAQPSLPRNAMMSTWLRSRIGSGHGMPARMRRVRFRISFSAHTFTILRGLCLL